MSEQTLPQNTPASQIISTILTGIKIDLNSGKPRSARTEAAAYLTWINPKTIRATEDGNWIEVNDGYQWSRVTADTMSNWLYVEHLPENSLGIASSEPIRAEMPSAPKAETTITKPYRQNMYCPFCRQITWQQRAEMLSDNWICSACGTQHSPAPDRTAATADTLQVVDDQIAEKLAEYDVLWTAKEKVRAELRRLKAHRAALEAGTKGGQS